LLFQFRRFLAIPGSPASPVLAAGVEVRRFWQSFLIRVYPRKSAVKQLLMLLVVQPEVPDHPIFPISVISENQW